MGLFGFVFFQQSRHLAISLMQFLDCRIESIISFLDHFEELGVKARLSLMRVIPSRLFFRSSDKWLTRSLTSTALQPHSAASSSYVIHIWGIREPVHCQDS
jgi:hypothetical protein